MSNIQVTHDVSTNNARSESAILINPNNPMQIVSSSKKFKNIHTYDFTLATSYSTDGGFTWHDSADIPIPGWDCLTDPTLAWDDLGNVYLVGLPGTNPPTFNTIGIAIYKSTDGGKTWSQPNLIHTSAGDDKQWAAGDANLATSSFHGRIYAVWDDGSQMRFARTLDHGATWTGTLGKTVANTSLANDSFSPEINVAANGDIYIVWIAGSTIKMLVSNDGGDSFHPVTSPATSVTTLSAKLPQPHGWPVFPGGNFRVLTVPTACVFEQTVVVAWDDFREKVSRIYYAVSNDGGLSWTTGPSGQPLLTTALPQNFQHFFPQIITDPNGVIGCAFYEFGPKPNTYRIDVMLAQSHDGGSTFSHGKVTDVAWDPTVDAPWSHGDSNVTFIGDYFGIDASSKGFYPLWTDTRTGIQELWTDIVPAWIQPKVPQIYGEVAQILFGIIQDGGGAEVVGGHIIHIDPWGPPELDILLGVAVHRIAALASDREGATLQQAAMGMVIRVAQKEIQKLEGKQRAFSPTAAKQENKEPANARGKEK
jgi:hypothetical protein